MARYPFFLVVGLVAAALLLTGAVSRPTAPSPPLARPASAAESAEAARLLAAAAEAYSPPRLVWAEMALWQKVWDDGEIYEVRGRYLGAPGHRLRLELKTRAGRTDGQLTVISDGAVLSIARRFGNDAPPIGRLALPVPEPPAGVETVAAARDEMLRDQALLGVGPLVKALRERLRAPARENVRWNGLEVIRITGAWPEDPGKLARVPDWQRPRYPARLCSIYLDAKTLWPHRIEWWGGEKAQDRAVLLLEMEFRDPILNRPLTPEQCTREFTPD